MCAGCRRICYTKLKLVLFAIELRHSKQNADGSTSTLGSIVVNPGDTVIIQERTQGFFIADSADEVKRCVRLHCSTRRRYSVRTIPVLVLYGDSCEN